jgi:NADH-quinone oxidoreductase subunit E
MLSDEERKELQHELDQMPYPRAACIEGLKIVQRHRGWVSDEALRDLADALAMTPDELDSIATFYSLIFRRPVGRHVILLCDSVSCWTLGYEEILRALERRLGVGFGGTTADGRFTLLPIPCLGCCDHAPALMIDDDLHQDLRADGLDEILARYD